MEEEEEDTVSCQNVSFYTVQKFCASSESSSLSPTDWFQRTAQHPSCSCQRRFSTASLWSHRLHVPISAAAASLPASSASQTASEFSLAGFSSMQLFTILGLSIPISNFLSFCISLCLSVSVSLSSCFSVALYRSLAVSLCLHHFVSVFLSVCLSVSLYLCITLLFSFSVCLCISVFVFSQSLPHSLCLSLCLYIILSRSIFLC